MFGFTAPWIHSVAVIYVTHGPPQLILLGGLSLHGILHWAGDGHRRWGAATPWDAQELVRILVNEYDFTVPDHLISHLIPDSKDVQFLLDASSLILPSSQSMLDPWLLEHVRQ